MSKSRVPKITYSQDLSAESAVWIQKLVTKLLIILKKELVVAYSRVSSSSQNLREQLAVLKSRDINKDEVLFLEDYSVSATKNDASNRQPITSCKSW
ncbi:recombinase family protein [Halobacillus amylolyticus]|uniref:Recombinase family protein n=1 Tax=Halobacillus amylolyticus TaxID=2932259 RepID=A0ABY4H7G3_9BACI|nr:recombinase family protein [Halobacillus amylolyticus]UOR10806.1 recombinase family protein [Halobacillus amylolyticus]